MHIFYDGVLLTTLFFSCFGLDSNKQQRYSPNTDFLAHESGGSAWPKKDYVALTNNDYNAQFPSLGSSHLAATTAKTTLKPTTIPSAKRDFVTLQITTQKLLNNGKRDYVASKLPTPTSQQPANYNSHVPQIPNGRPQPIEIRDYVAPQFTTQKPANTNTNTGKVKDLINFFDSKPKDQSGAQKLPSYSNILQGNNNSGTPTQPVATKGTQPTPTKPLSFSAVLEGSNKPSTPTSHVTQKPSTSVSGQGNLSPTTRPGSSILPSSLINTNRNTNQANNNGPSDAELQVLSEELLRKDTNNAAKYITINYQQKTTSQSKDDKAPQPLLSVAPEAWNIPTVLKLIPLLDNYERDTTVNEHVTPQERNEENAFMDVIMNTAVIRHLMNFLKERGYVSPDPRLQRDFVKQLWFNLYSRGKGKISSSGFEHIFVSELKNGDVQGLHNWIYFSREEAANRVNYLGYLKYQQLDDKGAVLKLHFNQQGADKPVDTMFIGTSPELEIALYTLCFVTRADNDCKLKLGTKDINIVSHTFRYRSKNYIGSAYPQI